MANTTVKYKGPMTPDESEPVDNATEEPVDAGGDPSPATKIWVANYVKGFMAGWLKKRGGGMGGMGGPSGMGGGGLLGGM